MILESLCISCHNGLVDAVKVTEDPKYPKIKRDLGGCTPPNVPAELKYCYVQTANGKPIGKGIGGGR